MTLYLTCLAATFHSCVLCGGVYSILYIQYHVPDPLAQTYIAPIYHSRAYLQASMQPACEVGNTDQVYIYLQLEHWQPYSAQSAGLHGQYIHSYTYIAINHSRTEENCVFPNHASIPNSCPGQHNLSSHSFTHLQHKCHVCVIIYRHTQPYTQVDTDI